MTTRAPQGRTRPGAADLQVGRPGVVWALPAALFFGLFALLPMVLVLVLSFTQWSGLGSPELVGTENRIAVERMRYNERVQEYNTSRRQFPSNITAGIFGFKEYPLFEAPESARQVPKVSF